LLVQVFDIDDIAEPHGALPLSLREAWRIRARGGNR
jgi:hypothetical protein